MAKILIVEDEQSIQKMIQYDLTQLGYEVTLASDGLSGLQAAKENIYDIIVLDLMLPKLSGLELCKTLRREHNQAYIIMLTAMDEEMQKIEGFDAGADDYMTKPFSPRELAARIKAALRRTEQKEKDVILKHQNITLNTQSYEAYLNDQKLTLTLKEFELLHYLIDNRGIVLSRDQLLKTLWGYSYDGDTRVVDVHIFKLRDKLDPKAQMIKTVRGVGYKLV